MHYLNTLYIVITTGYQTPKRKPLQTSKSGKGSLSTFIERKIDMTTLTQITVPFHGAELSVIEYNNQPYTPMKPIIDGMGLDWAAQYTKLKQRFISVIAEIATTGKDGKQYKMICLPVRKLPAWLYSIHANKVKPELRDTVIMYQNECDDVLWDYWTKGQAINQRKTITPEQQPLPLLPVPFQQGRYLVVVNENSTTIHDVNNYDFIEKGLMQKFYNEWSAASESMYKLFTSSFCKVDYIQKSNEEFENVPVITKLTRSQ